MSLAWIAAAKDAAVVLLPFNEESGLRASDVMGNLQDLAAPTGLTEPAVVTSTFGRARKWAAATGLTAAETVAGAGKTRLSRTMSVEVVATVDTNETATTRWWVSRGRGDSANEHRQFGLGLTYASGWKLQAQWQDSARVDKTVESDVFTMPSGSVHFACVRRWVSTTQFEFDFYVNGAKVGATKTSSGAGSADIVDGAGGTFLVGCRFSGGVFSTGLVSGETIDEIRVSDRERTAEELLLTYRRMVEFPSWGGDLVRAFLPPPLQPGDIYSRDPDSIVQRELSVLGDGIGQAWSLLEELYQDFLPDRATRALERWESVTKLAPGPLDTYAARRQRVTGHLKKVWGYNRDDIRKAVFELLGLTETQTEIVEVSNRLADPFGSIGDAWYQEANNGTISATGGGQPRARLQWAIGVDATWTPTNKKPVALRRAVGDGTDLWVIAQFDLVNLSLPNAGSACGVFYGDWFNNEMRGFGIRTDAGVLKWYRLEILGGVLTRTTMSAVPAGNTAWLRIRVDDAAGRVYMEATVDPGAGFDGYEGPYGSIVQVALPAGDTPAKRKWAGVYGVSEVDPSVDAGDVYVDEFRMREPKTNRVYEWYIYADPALTTNPDVASAQVMVDRMKPAHTDGKVIRSKALLYDDDNNLLDRDPLGG